MKNALNWFEIPATDFDRAKNFYQSLFNTELQLMEMPGYKAAMFPADLENGIGGCVMQGEGYAPSSSGTVVYLNGGDDLNAPLGRVEAAGGKVLQEKTSIGENGFVAFFEDTEGNRVGIHSNS